MQRQSDYFKGSQRSKKHFLQRDNSNILANFWTNIVKSRRQWNSIFIALKYKYLSEVEYISVAKDVGKVEHLYIGKITLGSYLPTH